MSNSSVTEIVDILACPHCTGNISAEEGHLVCNDCEEAFLIERGQADMVTRDGKKRTVDFDSESEFDLADERYVLLSEQSSPYQELRTSDPRFPSKLTGFLPAAESTDEAILDLACGDGVHKSLCEKKGYTWTGVDIDSSVAPVLSDAHNLPFASTVFSSVICMKALHLTENPFIVANEVYRILKTDSVFIGSVGFLEPLVDHSAFHLSPCALMYVLENAGFEVEMIAPGWHSLTAQARMGLYPYLPAFLSKLLVSPAMISHKIWNFVGTQLINHHKANKLYRKMKFAGELFFVAQKP